MSKRQKESAAKYLYDISKSIAILSLVGNIVQGKWDVPTLLFGFLGTLAFFACAYIFEGGLNHE